MVFVPWTSSSFSLGLPWCLGPTGPASVWGWSQNTWRSHLCLRPSMSTKWWWPATWDRHETNLYHIPSADTKQKLYSTARGARTIPCPSPNLQLNIRRKLCASGEDANPPVTWLCPTLGKYLPPLKERQKICSLHTRRKPSAAGRVSESLLYTRHSPAAMG